MIWEAKVWVSMGWERRSAGGPGCKGSQGEMAASAGRGGAQVICDIVKGGITILSKSSFLRVGWGDRGAQDGCGTGYVELYDVGLRVRPVGLRPYIAENLGHLAGASLVVNRVLQIA